MKRVLVIPAFNEEKTILDVLEISYNYADIILVVNDGSYDGTKDLVLSFSRAQPKVRLLNHLENQGKSGAFLTAFSAIAQMYKEEKLTADDVVITIDADGQHDPREIVQAVATMEHAHVDVLVGKRNLQGYPLFKKVGNRLLSSWASLLSGQNYPDSECGFRLMRVKVVIDLLLFFTGQRYGCEQEISIITARRGWRVSTAHVTTVPYYRTGTRVRDGITNVAMSVKAFRRVYFNRGESLERRLQSVMQNLDSLQEQD